MTQRIPIPQVHRESFPEVTQEGLLWLDLLRSKSIDLRIIQFTFDPASIAASTTVEQTVTINGLKTDDVILAIIKPSLDAGVTVGQGRVSSVNTLSITYINASVGAVDPISETYTLVYLKNSRV